MATSEWKIDVLLEGNWRGASCVLLTNGSSPVLVDTGMPHDAHKLVGALASRGIEPAAIRCIVNTHFHLDHVSNNSLFRHSAIYASQQSYDWCRSLYSDLLDEASWECRVLRYYPEIDLYPRAREHMAKLRNLALRWWDLRRAGAPSQFRWLEEHSLPEGIEARFTAGHVPGHVSLVIRNLAGATVIAGDAVLTRTHDDQVLTMIPFSRAQYLEERREILSIEGEIIPGHDKAFLNVPGSPGVSAPE